MSTICQPCNSIIAVCPDLFSGGTIPTPVPTRQRVCNTEQTASCPDGSNPVVVEAGTFCTVVLNPTASSIATTQAALDAQALAQAQSEVGDCAWSDFVWVVTALPGDSNLPYPATSGSGEAGTFNIETDSVCGGSPSGNGVMDLRIDGNIDYVFDAGVSHNWRITLTFNDNTDQFIENSVVLFSPNDFFPIGSAESHPVNSGPQSGTVIKTIDFTALYDGITPIHYHIFCRIQIYSGNVGSGCHARSGSVSGVITSLD